jgi:hypothetical protein
MLPANTCGYWHNDLWTCRAGCRGKKPSPLDALDEAEIRDSSRAGSQAPNAPPALTFGLPGKQKVKPTLTGRILMCPVNSLPQNIKNFTHRTP